MVRSRDVAPTLAHVLGISMPETLGPLRLLGIQFKLKGTPATVRRPPTLWQHTEGILREELERPAHRRAAGPEGHLNFALDSPQTGQRP
jgi:hypothetical protein